MSRGEGKAFEAALATPSSALEGETLWFRMVAGGPTPRYVRLRPGASLSALLENEHEASLPGSVKPFLLKTTTEILNFRPTMSYGLVGGEPR